MHSNEKKTIKSIIRYGIIAVISLVLVFPSMEILKKLPGYSSKTGSDYYITSLFVMVIWFIFLTLCDLSVNNLKKYIKPKNKPSNINVQPVVKGKTKKLGTSTKIVLECIKIIACVIVVLYFMLMFYGFSIDSRR